jgi:acetoin utilization protein AcuB
MNAIEIITPDVPPLRPQDDIARALEWMEAFKVSHLPVVNDGRLVGMVKEDDLIDRNDPNASIGHVMDQVELPFVRSTQHLFKVIELFSERGLTVVPVLDDMGLYLGSITEHEALRRMATAAGVHEPGGVVVLEMNQADLSLQLIARIVEGSDARLISMFTRTLPDTNRLEVTLKINREEISDILQTFERYDIFVKSTYQGSRFHEDLRDRYDELMRYIDP